MIRYLPLLTGTIWRFPGALETHLRLHISRVATPTGTIIIIRQRMGIYVHGEFVELRHEDHYNWRVLLRHLPRILQATCFCHIGYSKQLVGNHCLT